MKMSPRTLWFEEIIEGESVDEDFDWMKPRQIAPPETANLISSRLENGMHAPTLDIDLPCQLVPSSTEGHFHLYIDKELTWEQYRLLLAVLADVGIIERGYYKMSSVRDQSFLRRPGVKKEVAANGSGSTEA